jgi:acetyl-CoA carboxylase biotin carboxyl carrier protein
MDVYMEININVIKQLIESLDKSSVDKLHINTKDFDVTLEKTQPVYTEARQIPVQAGSAPAKPAVASANEAAAPETKGNIVKAPIIGTFYVSPAPEKPPFIAVGQKVQKGDVLFIIESMKLMNEVTSEYNGTVAEIFVQQGNAVEYGQPVMRIE